MAMAKLQVQTMTWLLVIVLNTGTITLPQPSKNHCFGAMATAIDRAYHTAKDRGEFRVYSAQCVAEIYGDNEPPGDVACFGDDSRRSIEYGLGIVPPAKAESML
jgi:hypothetical protein